MGKTRPTASGPSSAATRRHSHTERPVLKRLLSRAASLSVLLGADLVAAAEPSSPEQLFEHGVAALRTGDYAEACPAIERSQTADPRLGTLLALADCLDKWGKLHAAVLRHEQVIAEISKLEPAQREYRAAQLEYARLAAARLWLSVPRLNLVAPKTPTQLELLLDGSRIPTTDTDMEVPVDPGTHRVETRAPGHAPWTQTLEVTPGEHRRVELQVGTPLATVAPPSAVVSSGAPARSAPPAVEQQTSEPGSESSAWRYVGWSLGGVGVAGAVAGSVAGVLLLDACPNLSCELGDRRARDLALATDVGFGVALVGLVSAAIILVQTAPGPDRSTQARWAPTAAVGPGSAWLGLSQRW